MYRVSTLSRCAAMIKVSLSYHSQHPTPSPHPALSRFLHDRKGNVTIPFGLMIIIMCLFTGGAVDIGRWMQARNQTQEAIDAAVLAGLVAYDNYLMTTPNGLTSTAQTLANQAALTSYRYNIAKRAPVLSDSIAFTMINSNTEMTATGDVTIATPFLALAHVSSLPVLKTNGSELAISKAGVGTNTGTSFEIAMMIDNTGSMCESAATAGTGNCASDVTTSKIYAVKQAATNLVNTMIWKDQSVYTSKIALIPFTEAVNLGSATLANAARGTLKSVGGNGSVPVYSCTNGRHSTCSYNNTAAVNADTLQGWQGLTYTSNSQNGTDDYGLQWSAATFWASSTCVTERTGTHKYDDTSPLSAPVGFLYNEPVTYSNQWNWLSSAAYSQYDTVTTYSSQITNGVPNSNSTDWCAVQAPLMPLTSNVTSLTDAIAAMTTGGGTAGHLGTAWAWYTLSPNFNSLWALSTGAQAQPYSAMSVLNSFGKPALRKVAILMTDGDYNFEYNNGVYDCYVSSNCTPTNDTSKNQAAALCTAMKAQGIEIYTIGAMVSTSAQQFLTSCATDSTHYFNATSTSDITAAFAAITAQLIRPYLTH